MIKSKNGPHNSPDEPDWSNLTLGFDLSADAGVSSGLVVSPYASNLTDVGPARNHYNVVPIVAQQRVDWFQVSKMPEEHRKQIETDIHRNIAMSIAEEMLRKGLIEFQDTTASPYGDVTIQGIAHVVEEPF